MTELDRFADIAEPQDGVGLVSRPKQPCEGRGFCSSVRNFKLGKLPQNAFEQQLAITQPVAMTAKA